MIFVALALLGFGLADLVRWSPDRVGARHAAVAAAVGTAAVATVAALGGMAPHEVLVVGIVGLAVLLPWSTYDLFSPKWAKPEYALALVVGVLIALIALSGSADPIGGDLASWYANLGFGFSDRVSVDQFILGVGAGLFLLVSANRVVRYTLAATRASLVDEESNLRGGRLLRPMERLIVAASVVSGDLAGAGFVIAAKGLLRFREIHGDRSRVDEVTEYFLVGTFTSVLVAAALGGLVLAAA